MTLFCHMDLLPADLNLLLLIDIAHLSVGSPHYRLCVTLVILLCSLIPFLGGKGGRCMKPCLIWIIDHLHVLTIHARDAERVPNHALLGITYSLLMSFCTYMYNCTLLAMPVLHALIYCDYSNKHWYMYKHTLCLSVCSYFWGQYTCIAIV